jgi:nitrite reductase/ring-hydroxylating ferredoxin subunit
LNKEDSGPTQNDVEGHPDLADVEVVGAADLADGTMMELKVGPGKQDNVLVTRYGGKLYAIGAYCSHFGAPLVTGVLFDDKVLCPWHAAGFSVVTGAIESAPGMDGVPKYSIHEKNGKYFVRVPKKMQQK